MPRTGERRQQVDVRMGAAGIAHVMTRAEARTLVESKPVGRSEMIRRMLSYAAAHMPASYGAPEEGR